MTDALDILLNDEPEQRSPEWFNARLGRFTSSRFGELMTGEKKPLTESATAMKVVCEKAIEAVSSDRKEFSAPSTDHGTEYEPEAVAAYQANQGVTVIDSPLIKKGSAFGGSPDGLVGLDGLIEVKCPYNLVNHVHTFETLQVPKKYIWQVQGNLWVTGREWCDFISYSPFMPEASKIVIVRATRDKELIERLVKRLHQAEELKQLLIKKLTGK